MLKKKYKEWKTKVVSRISAAIPFSYYGILRREIGTIDSKKVLDVGCGPGAIMWALNSDKKHSVDGIDIFKPDIAKARKTGVYKKLIVGDIFKVDIPPKSYDIVTAFHVVEHFKKNDALRFLSRLEGIAKEKVIIVTPLGFVEQHGHDGNKYQEHLSGWYKEDFTKRGYRVIAQGLGIFTRNKRINTICTKMGPLNNIFFLAVSLMQPLLAHNFSITHQLICVKEYN